MIIEPYQPQTRVFIIVEVKGQKVEVPAVVWLRLSEEKRRVYCPSFGQYFDLPISALRELTPEERKVRDDDDD